LTNPLIPLDVIAATNEALEARHDADYSALGDQLDARGIDIERLVVEAMTYTVTLPSWGTGTGGTRFARFPGGGEPQSVFDKIEDCAVVHQLSGCTPSVSLHIPWDYTTDTQRLTACASSYGLEFGPVNSNSFQDQDGQQFSYKFGSLSHTNPKTRQQAIEHNLACVSFGQDIGAKALSVWVGDGSNFPGQVSFSRSLDNYLESMVQIYKKTPDDWLLLLEHKLFEPGFYATVIQDWGSSYLAADHLGDRAKCLVDLGHHAPSVNVEMIVSRLAQFGKLGGLHFNDSKYGDDDLDSGAVDPYQLFLIFNELREIRQRDAAFAPELMLDQSHNVTDPIESLTISAIETQRAFIQSSLVDVDALEAHQNANDALMASETLKAAFRTNVGPILAEARRRGGGPLDPLTAYRRAEHRQKLAQSRPPSVNRGGGIV
jgi:L-rhamnose isomerase/sugar isomerase